MLHIKFFPPKSYAHQLPCFTILSLQSQHFTYEYISAPLWCSSSPPGALASKKAVKSFSLSNAHSTICAPASAASLCSTVSYGERMSKASSFLLNSNGLVH